MSAAMGDLAVFAACVFLGWGVAVCDERSGIHRLFWMMIVAIAVSGGILWLKQ